MPHGEDTQAADCSAQAEAGARAQSERRSEKAGQEEGGREERHERQKESSEKTDCQKETTTRPRAKSVAQIAALIRAAIVQNPPTPGDIVPVSLFESLYQPTGLPIILSALGLLVSEGLLTQTSESNFAVNAPAPS